MSHFVKIIIFSFLLSFLFLNSISIYGQDAYDPFVDYREFDEPEKEKEDIQFFQYGRFVTLSFITGFNTMTSQMAQYVTPSPSFGFSLGFFFDLRFSMLLSYWVSDHPMSFKTKGGNKKDLTISFEDISLHLKYHLNTQKLTKGLAFLNPYFILGMGRLTRTFKTDSPELGVNPATDIEGGLGIEIPLLRSKMYLGFQGLYHYVHFSDESTNQVIDSESNSGVYFKGDLLSASVHLGINF